MKDSTFVNIISMHTARNNTHKVEVEGSAMDDVSVRSTDEVFSSRSIAVVNNLKGCCIMIWVSKLIFMYIEHNHVYHLALVDKI